MSAKLPIPLKEENPNLHKQIGCISGIFHLFDRNHFLGGRRIGGQNHQRLPPAGQSGKHASEYKSTTQKIIGKTAKEIAKEKQRVSTESSRTSFSSSCSSTFSSADCNRTAQPEPSCLSQNAFSEIPSQIIPKRQPNSSFHVRQQSHDLRELVKDSIYREPRGLSVKTTTAAEGISHVKKLHIDSPRPMQLSKPVSPKLSASDGSSRVLTKLPEAARRSNNEKARAFPSKDAPRFSYDGRESQNKWKSNMKLKELPRLSLDSREGSIRRSAMESRSNYLLDDQLPGSGKSGQPLNTQQEPGSNKRPSGIVAKLMGLEAFPDSPVSSDDQIRHIKRCGEEDLDATSISSQKDEESKLNQVSRSPRTPKGETALPQLRKVNPVAKPKPRVPLEPAPWRQKDGNRGSQRPAVKGKTESPSVYGEIEKRLTELEFKRSGKDLRALKQILEAMQKTRERLESRKEEQGSDLEPQTSKVGPDYHNLNQIPSAAMQGSPQRIRLITPATKGTSHPKKFESSIMVVKPARIVQKPISSGSSAIPVEGLSGLRKLRTSEIAESNKDLFDQRRAKDLTPRSNRFREPACQPLHSMCKSPEARTYRSTQTPKAHQDMRRSNQSSTAVSPRLQQKKQSQPTTQTSDSSRARRNQTKHQTESGSPSRQFKSKSPNLRQGDGRSTEISGETRELSHQGDAISLQSESNISSTSQFDIEVTSIDLSKGTYHAYHHKDQRDEIAARLSEDEPKAVTAIATLEQPSPVSVLDTAFYGEESPSPVKKKISNAFKDEETLNFDDAEWNSVDLEHLLNSTKPSPEPGFDQEKLENVKHLVQKLRQVDSTYDEAATDYIASLCDNTNPEHRYITEIMLASGLLLQDLSSNSASFIQLHPLGHLINPNLFIVLEQTKGRNEFPSYGSSNGKINQSKFIEKIHRKLIFDTVNEILVRKLTRASFSELWTYPSKLGARNFSGQKLLKELCSEIDHLRPPRACSLDAEDDGLTRILSDDMIHDKEKWADYKSENPGLVLDIERQIFKDLISEIVSGEVASQPGRPTKHCRQLFPK